jgi:hypothetical protein
MWLAWKALERNFGSDDVVEGGRIRQKKRAPGNAENAEDDAENAKVGGKKGEAMQSGGGTGSVRSVKGRAFAC